MHPKVNQNPANDKGVARSDTGAGTTVKRMDYYNKILCIEGGELILSENNPDGLMSLECYKKMCQRNKLTIVRRGCYGTPALVEYDSLPAKYRTMWEARHGDPRKKAISHQLVDKVRLDNKAIAFYSDYMLSNGEHLPVETQAQYANEASVLNAVHHTVNDRAALRRAGGNAVRISQIWEGMVETIHDKDFTKRYPHSLPKTAITLKRKHDKYIKEGYQALIHSGYCNDNSRKVSAMTERLILALYTAPNKPFAATVYDMWNLFVTGKIEVFDKKTGELFDRKFFMKNDRPLELSESTIWSYINNPKNRITVDEIRNDSLYNSNIHRPFHRRRSPKCSFSKISMDDRDLARKLHNGKRVKAYYAYDVTSGCVIGRAYNRSKNEELFVDCMQDMFRTIERNGWGMPMEVEVEHHLVNKFFDDLARMFPYLRICNPGNSREKRAEHGNKAKKYGTEKKLGQPVGRWWSRHEAYYQPQSKVNDEYVIPMGHYDEIVADDMAAVARYNNELHPRQKTYPGMTRWQVLCENLNPDLPRLNKAMLCRYVGYRAQTSVRASKEVTVQNAQYQLPHVEVMSRLKPNNLTVEAYYIPDDEGLIGEVHLYQGDTFIGTCQKITPYNEAKAEQTAADIASFEKQSAYDAQYRKMVKDHKDILPKIETIEPEAAEALQSIEVKPVAVAHTPADSFNVDELLNNFDAEAIRKSAQINL